MARSCIIMGTVLSVMVTLAAAQLDPRKPRNAMERPVGMPIQRQSMERQPVEQAVPEGGRAPVPVDDPIVQQVAEFAAQKWAESANNLEGFTAGRIAAAHKQATITPDAKDQYDLDLEFDGTMGTTRLMHVEVARMQSGAMELLQAATVFTLKVNELTSEPEEAPRPGMIGAFQPASINTPDIRSAAVELARIKPDLEAGAALVLCKASTQVVAGVNFQLDIGVGGCEDSHFHIKGRVFRSLQNQFQASISP